MPHESPALGQPAGKPGLPPPLFNAQDFFAVPLVDLGSLDNQAMAGIYTPEPEIGQAKVGLTSQFLEDAATYHQKYSNTAMFKALISRALQHTGLPGKSPAILDIGSGSGNSVFPCLELMPRCRILATDLSPNLLRILLDHVQQNPSSHGRVVPVCMDATRDYYQPGAFDFVVGAAILHHLLDPAAAIRAAARALKPGGHAIFFEPFEAGNAILRLAYHEILERVAAERVLAQLPPRWVSLLRWVRPWLPQPFRPETTLPDDVATLLAAMIKDFTVRAGLDKSAPIYKQIDDKWLFTRSYIEEHAHKAGFSQVLTLPIYEGEQPFSAQTKVNLALGIGAQPERLPSWAWQILDRYDQTFSTEVKRDLFVEGIVVLKKD